MTQGHLPSHSTDAPLHSAMQLFVYSFPSTPQTGLYSLEHPQTKGGPEPTNSQRF